MTTALGFKPDSRHLMLQNSTATLVISFCIPKRQIILPTLHADISTKASLSDDVTDTVWLVTGLGTSKLEGDTISDDRRVAVSDVGEWTSVNEDGSAFEGLHKSGLDSVLHENGHGTGTSDVLSGDWVTTAAGTNDHAAKSSREEQWEGQQML